MPKVATIIVPLSNEHRDKITRQILCSKLCDDIYDGITQYNKTICIPVERENAAVHLVDFFALGECVKNSLDSGSTQLTIDIDTDNDAETVTVAFSDNGTGTENTIQAYPYEEAFLSISEKQSMRTENQGESASPILGGAGKGLAMSTQFMVTFNEGSLSTGKSKKYPQGFEVSITAPNKTRMVDWNNYMESFEKEFSNRIRHLRENRPFSPTRLHDGNASPSPQSPIKETEHAFKRQVMRSQNASPLTSPAFTGFFSPNRTTDRGNFPSWNLLVAIPRDEDDVPELTLPILNSTPQQNRI